MDFVKGNYNYAEIKLANSKVVNKYVGKIIDWQENDPARQKGKIFLAYTTTTNGHNHVAQSFLCSGYGGWEDARCQPEYGGWSYDGVKTFFEKVVPISRVIEAISDDEIRGIRMHFSKNDVIFENDEDEESFIEIFRKMAEELE